MRSGEYHNVSISDLFKIISELSLNMNNQILEVKNLGMTLVQLIKYQDYNKWGIRILTVSLDDEQKSNIEEFLNEKMTYYQIYFEQGNCYKLDIDVKNNIQMTVEILKFLFVSFYQLKDTSLFSCVYTKSSVLTT
jgi:hypothetical protein